MLSLDLSTSRLHIDPRLAEFADREVEDRFLRQSLPERGRQTRTSLLIAAVFYVAFGATDVATLGATPVAWMLVALRVLVAVVGIGGWYAIRRHPESLRVPVGAVCALLVTGLPVFLVVCWFQPETMAWNTMSQALMVMAVYVNFPNRFVYSVALGLGFSAAFAVMLCLQGMLAPDDLLTLVLLLVMGNALGYIAARRIQVAQREQFRAAMQLQQMADRDPLTGCYNRRVLQRGLLDAELARCRRYGAALSVVLCDIDHFKRINDTHGHAAGDQVLESFAHVLRTMTREAVDRVIRYGGEEFLIVLPHTDLAGAQALAERIRTAFAVDVMHLGDNVYLTASASFGVATVPAELTHASVSFEELVGLADAQLYAAKGGGRNRVCAAILAPAADHGQRRA
ncbi:GGDEF domain-containing protein [Massilia sp. KIM]|uniref:GGDEF domain-containing protein n=1 Tax=Massilia sp. KIM TaxID=1955422 RepID=UPI0015C2DE61|nr:GGDEF domain-containing protein [Massilia sp. KIM]